ncbi:hypothetical protein DMI65_15880 [Escherichia coli]|nr:hypothetical protein [Escherichia coli]
MEWLPAAQWRYQWALQPARRKLGQEQGDTKTHQDGDQQRDKRGHQRTVDRHQRPVDIVRRIPLFGPQESQTKFRMLGGMR